MMIELGLRQPQIKTDKEINTAGSLLGKVLGHSISTPSGESKTEYTRTKEEDTMTSENSVTQEQLKFAEQDANHKLDIINIKIDDLTKTINTISTKAEGIDELKTTTAVLSEKESTTRALAWAIVVAIVGGLIKLILF